MAAVSTLVDRIYRDFLNKPDDLSAFSRLDGAMSPLGRPLGNDTSKTTATKILMS